MKHRLSLSERILGTSMYWNSFVFITALALACTASRIACAGEQLHARVDATIGRGNDSLVLTIPNAHIVLNVVAPGILHVHYIPTSGVTPTNIVMNPRLTLAHTAASVRRTGDNISFDSPVMDVVWSASANELKITKRGDGVILVQKYLPALAAGAIIINTPRSGAVYGIGGFRANESVAAGLIRQGTWVARAGMQGHAGAPLVWSTDGYAILADCNGAVFHIQQHQLVVDDMHRDDIDYYIIVGDPYSIFDSVRKLSGETPLFPKWSLGFINSPFGVNQNEVLQIVNRYRGDAIPFDAFAFDYDWKAWGEGDYGEFRWNAQKFPDGPSGRLAVHLRSLGVHIAGIMKPRLLIDSREGRYATAHRFWLPREKPFRDYFTGKFMKALDFDHADVRKWFGSLAIRFGYDSGIRGWWNDEADEFNSNTEALNMERALYDAQRSRTNVRVWSINRNFWLGAQRYAYGLWSGDIDTGFASMAAQRARMLSAVDVGEMNWGMDGGGFHGHPSSELYARWVEFGAFTPIFRVHGTLHEMRQPWLYGKTAEAAAVRAIKLRYELIPYIYSFEDYGYRYGVGIVRPLMFDWPHDKFVRNDVDEWMFGKWLLVSPIVRRNQTVKTIYLPPGQWINWFTGVTYNGNRTVTHTVDNHTWRDIPLFIRSGAMIPIQPVRQHIGGSNPSRVRFLAFPSPTKSSFMYYDDNGRTYAYERGKYFSQTLSMRRTRTGVLLTTAQAEGTYEPAPRWYIVDIHSIRGTAVTLNGHRVRRVASRAALLAASSGCWFDSADRYGVVTEVKMPTRRAIRVVVSGRRR